MRRLLVLLFVVLLAGGLFAQKHKKKPDEEPRPQVLEVIPEPPEAVLADSGRLSFQVSPLSDKGLLSQQVRDALKAVARLNHGASILKVRAFVAGSGDLRRIKDIVAEEFTEKKQTLPAVSTIQVGALPLPGAQVVIEAISSERKVVNPSGVAFVSASESANAGSCGCQAAEFFGGHWGQSGRRVARDLFFEFARRRAGGAICRGRGVPFRCGEFRADAAPGSGAASALRSSGALDHGSGESRWSCKTAWRWSMRRKWF